MGEIKLSAVSSKGGWFCREELKEAETESKKQAGDFPWWIREGWGREEKDAGKCVPGQHLVMFLV